MYCLIAFSFQAALTRAPIYGEEAHTSREQNLEDRADRRNREISPARTAPRSGLRGQSDSLPQSLTSEGPPSSPEDQSNTDIVFRSEVLHEVWNDEIGVPHRPERTRSQSRASTPVNRWANTGIKSDDAPNLVCSLGIMVDVSFVLHYLPRFIFSLRRDAGRPVSEPQDGIELTAVTDQGVQAQAVRTREGAEVGHPRLLLSRSKETEVDHRPDRLLPLETHHCFRPVCKLPFQ